MSVSWSNVALQPGSRTIARTSTQGFTETGTPAQGDGIDLDGLESVMVEITAPGVETFDGTGSIVAYHQNDPRFDVGAAWTEFPRGSDTLEDHAGKSVIKIVIPITHRAGRFSVQPNGVGHSGAGSTLTLRLIGVRSLESR